MPQGLPLDPIKLLKPVPIEKYIIVQTNTDLIDQDSPKVKIL